jgi:hypothetical protein
MDKATLLGFLHLLCPEHSSEHPAGLWIHLPPRPASLPTIRRSLARLSRSTGVVRDSAWVPSICDLARWQVLVVPFRVFALTARPSVSPPRDVLSGLATRSEFLTRCGTALIG